LRGNCDQRNVVQWFGFTTRTALTAKARIVLKILPLLLVPVFAAAVAYWLTRSRAAAVTTGAVVLGAMLFIGITS
jgi:hypothetical protein